MNAGGLGSHAMSKRVPHESLDQGSTPRCWDRRPNCRSRHPLYFRGIPLSGRYVIRGSTGFP